MNKKFEDALKIQAVRSGAGIEGSGAFISLYTKNYKDDPLCALQLGIAVMLDKPMGFLVPTGFEVVDNLKRLARAIEYYDPDDNESLSTASKRLTDALIEDGND